MCIVVKIKLHLARTTTGDASEQLSRYVSFISSIFNVTKLKQENNKNMHFVEKLIYLYICIY